MARSRASCVVSKSTGTESPWKEIGGPSLDLRAPSLRQPVGRSAVTAETLVAAGRTRAGAGLVVDPVAPPRGLGGGVAGHGATAGVQRRELALRVSVRVLERGEKLLLDDVERLEREAGAGRRRTELGGQANALRRRGGELVPAPCGRERALGV